MFWLSVGFPAAQPSQIEQAMQHAVCTLPQTLLRRAAAVNYLELNLYIINIRC